MRKGTVVLIIGVVLCISVLPYSQVLADRLCPPLFVEPTFFGYCACTVWNYSQKDIRTVTITVYGGDNSPHVTGPVMVQPGEYIFGDDSFTTNNYQCGCRVHGEAGDSRVTIMAVSYEYIPQLNGDIPLVNQLECK
jgi:hypothetical protein